MATAQAVTKGRRYCLDPAAIRMHLTRSGLLTAMREKDGNSEIGRRFLALSSIRFPFYPRFRGPAGRKTTPIDFHQYGKSPNMQRTEWMNKRRMQ